MEDLVEDPLNPTDGPLLKLNPVDDPLNSVEAFGVPKLNPDGALLKSGNMELVEPADWLFTANGQHLPNPVDVAVVDPELNPVKVDVAEPKPVSGRAGANTKGAFSGFI